MRILLVYCHPNPESFTAAVRATALEALARGGHEVREIDLYGEGFDPVLDLDERRDYHTAGRNEIHIVEHLKMLLWAEGLLLVYPTWWYAQPAMLKGWLDRVWVPHVTFTMPDGQKPIRGLMTNIRLIAVVTTLGSPRWWWWVMGAPGQRILLRGIRALCNSRCKTLWLALHRIDTIGDKERQAFLDRVAMRLSRL